MQTSTIVGRVASYLFVLFAAAPLLALGAVWLWIVGLGFFPGADTTDMRADGQRWLGVLTIAAAVFFAADMLLIPLIVGEPDARRRRTAAAAACLVGGILAAAALGLIPIAIF